MPAIHQIIPNAEDLLGLEPEEIGVVLLRYICSGSEGSSPRIPLKRGNMFTGTASPAHGYPQQYWERTEEALMAAWVWLEREGLLLPAPGQQDRDWVFVSRRGRALLSKENFEAYKHSSLFPRTTLIPSIATNTFALFLRGHYDTVVFEAFRAVEAAVRDASGLPQTLVGTDLMRKAFAENTGPLTDTSLIASEQQATSNLFAGAIGLFTNPP